MEQLYRSPNGDTWFLARNPTTGLGFIRHQANALSGGRVTDIEIATFLSGPPHPEQKALLASLGPRSSIRGAPRLRTNRPARTPKREWSDADLTALGNMLVRGLSIEEIAQLLDRDRGDIQDKVVEKGRTCRGSTAAKCGW
jgi:hypothetical protein